MVHMFERIRSIKMVSENHYPFWCLKTIPVQPEALLQPSAGPAVSFTDPPYPHNHHLTARLGLRPHSLTNLARPVASHGSFGVENLKP